MFNSIAVFIGFLEVVNSDRSAKRYTCCVLPIIYRQLRVTVGERDKKLLLTLNKTSLE